jgi:hypothetical protein
MSRGRRTSIRSALLTASFAQKRAARWRAGRPDVAA